MKTRITRNGEVRRQLSFTGAQYAHARDAAAKDKATRAFVEMVRELAYAEGYVEGLTRQSAILQSLRAKRKVS